MYFNCDGKAEFSSSLLQSSVSRSVRNHSNMMICCSRNIY